MRITADTIVLVRAAVQDDEAQASAAAKVLREADVIAVLLPCLCEFVWVLESIYRIKRDRIVSTVRALLDTANGVMNRPGVDAGLAIYAAGGDFADGVIAFEGNWLGGEVFVSFDKRPVTLLSDHGRSAKLLS